MGALGNTPRRTTMVTLEARKSFAFGVNFLYAANGAPLSLVGATLRLVVEEPQHLGGAVALTKTAVLTDAANGLARFELQASDLALAEAEFPYTITLVTSDGYSTPVDKGVFDIRANPDADVTNTYTGVNPAQALTVTLGTSNQITVEVTSLQGPQGLPGEPGAPGLPGTNGLNGTSGVDGLNGTNGADGANGLSAYEVALANGFVGTEAEWLVSIKGAKGDKGDPGTGSVNSVNGDLGPDITLTAAEVGASPTGHTHTAAEVGASPTGHTHTAAEVGAAPASHTHTAATISYGGSSTLVAADVESALDELDTEKAPVGHTHPASPATTTKTINNQTGTTYTVALTDAGPDKWLRLSNAAAITLTIPTNATVAFPVGSYIEGNQSGAGQVTIVGAGGVTVNADPGLKVAAQYGTFGLLKVGTDSWLAYGRLAA